MPTLNDEEPKAVVIIKKVGTIFGKIILGAYVLIAVSALGYGLYLSIITYNLQDWLIGFATIVGAIVLCVSFIFLLGMTIFSDRSNRIFAMIGGIIAMLYHKVCPHITWEGTPPVKKDN